MTTHTAPDGRHGASVARIQKIIGLLTELKQRDMRRDDMCQYLGFSPSGVRKYVTYLRAEGVMQITRYEDGTDAYIGVPVYGLSPDRARVDAFLEELATNPVPEPRAQRERS